MNTDADILRVPAGPGTLHVERYGHGPSAIILLHGFATYSFLWRRVAPRLAAANHTAFAIDLLGYGESDRPRGADFGIAAQAEYLEHAMTAMRVHRAVVVGVDVGAGVALRLAAIHPARVERLVLINPLAFDAVPGRDVKELQRRTLRFVLRLSRGVMGAAPLLTPLLRRAVAREDTMTASLLARYLAPYTGSEGGHHLLLLARALRRRDLGELDLRLIKASTLVLWGEQDPWLDPRLGDRLVNAIRDARIVRLPSASRLIPEDDADWAAEQIVRFSSGK